ncbi:MAG: hypothetical protein GKR88_15760 [Flavobacteriaceae bacterium]|nr:MAG: hypothetical protein GKR88_15760 [Flavobacteriaceae bacterium]
MEATLNQNLQEYININSDTPLGEVIACAASENQRESVSYIFYYPIEGATDIRYYETETTSVDSNDFSNYTMKSLQKEAVFGGKLERFVRLNSEESWSIVTFMFQGALHRSNPIRLKNESKPTEYKNTVNIDQMQSLMPLFTWSDGIYPDNTIYFQVIDIQQQFLSGTYTYDRWFQYKNTTNVLLDINTNVPPSLVLGENYNFTLMGVSVDNWVNLIIEKPFTAQ